MALQETSSRLAEHPFPVDSDDDNVSAKWRAAAIAAAVAFICLCIVLVVRPAGVTIAGDMGGGRTFEVVFDKSEVSLTAALKKILQPITESQGNDEGAAVLAVLEHYGLYQLGSDRMFSTIRKMDTKSDLRHRFARLLFDLEGPFARPDTLAGVDDDRLVDALEDLYATNPDNPLVRRLWLKSLELEGIFGLRPIRAFAYPHDTLEGGEAAVCPDSMLDGKRLMVTHQTQSGIAPGISNLTVGPKVPISTACVRTVAAVDSEPIAERVWLSQEEFKALGVNDKESGSPTEVQVWAMHRHSFLESSD